MSYRRETVKDRFYAQQRIVDAKFIEQERFGTNLELHTLTW